MAEEGTATIRRQGRPYYRTRTNVDVLAVLDTEPELVKTVEERVEPIRDIVPGLAVRTPSGREARGPS